MNVSEDSTVLSSWKDIARYLGKGVRTVQRWERHLGLPVRRPIGALQKSAVLLYRGDVDAWLATRFSARAAQKPENQRAHSSSTRSTLRDGIRVARELREANQALTEEIAKTIRELSMRCELLSSQSLRNVNPVEDASLTTGLNGMADLLPTSHRLPTERIA